MNGPTVLVRDDGMRNGQALAGAFADALSGEERIKYATARLLGNAGAAVA